ncbi:Conidiation protein 6-domain-containing protein, partial [Pyronema domesticum]
GHKANLHNPNTSEESKEHSRQFLENIDRESGLHHVSGLQNHRDPVMVDFDRPVVVEEKNLGNVIGGYKATLHNPRVSEEAKERAAHALEELGVEPDYHPKSRDEDM